MLEQKIFYTARYDAVFKNIFGKEETKEYLRKFLEKVLDIEIEHLILKQQKYEKKGAIPNPLGILIKSKNKTIHLEINSGIYCTLRMRNFTYLCSSISSRKEAKHSLEKEEFIQLNIVWGLDKKGGLAKQKYKFLSCYNERVYIENITMYEVNMDLLMEMWRKGDKEKALQDKYFLMLGLEKEELEKLCEGDELMEAYEEKIKELNDDVNLIEIAASQKDAEMFYNTLISKAKETGMQEGLKKGLIKTAKKMLKKGSSVTFVSECTGLDLQKVICLKE